MSGPLAALGAVGKAALSIAARSFLSVETPPYASSGHAVSTVKKIKRGRDKVGVKFYVQSTLYHWQDVSVL